MKGMVLRHIRQFFSDICLDTPNCSGRIDNLRAAILRPQLANIETNIERWNERYRTIDAKLRQANAVHVPIRPKEERYVGSSFQFLLPGISSDGARKFVAENKKRGVELKWFGDDEPVAFTSSHKSWRYVDAQSLPKTDDVLAGLFDIRIPLTFSLEDCSLIVDCVQQFSLGEPD